MKYIGRAVTLLCVILISASINIFSQEKSDSLRIVLPNPVNKATLVGIGSSSLYDTYLSPLEYTGVSFRVINERMKRLSWFGGKFTRQQTIELEFAKTDNPAKNATEYWLKLDYAWGGHYNFYRINKFSFSAGAIWNTTAGILYNERNSNNPATGRIYTNINLSAIAFYEWKFATFRWQLDSPIVGMLFSPHYGQSYYEISLGNSVGVVNFASLHNQRALRNYFTVDVPVNKVSLRFGYLGNYYQTKVHGIQTHNYSNNFVIGLVSESINLSGRKIKDTKQVQSSFYFY